MEKTFIVKVTVPANQAANSRLPAKIIFDPTRGEEDYYQVPTYGGMVIKDIFVKDSPAIDGILIVKKDGQEIYWTHPISTLLISNPSRPKEPATPILYVGGQKLELDFINLDAGGSSDTELTIFMKVDVETG